MNFSIGQVIYILNNEKQIILPAIVQDEIHHRSLSGETVSYKVLIGSPNNPKSKIIDLSKLGNEGEVFSSLEEIRTVLVDRLTSFVDSLCQQTQQRSDEWYGRIETEFANNAPQERIDTERILEEVSQPIQNSQSPQFVEIKGGTAAPLQQGNNR